MLGMLALPLLLTPLFAQSPLGPFTDQTDVGDPTITGSAAYDAAHQSFHIEGGGANIWGERDEFQYVYRKMRGDFILRTHASFEGEGVDPHRKIGWMIRHSLEAHSPCALATVHGDGLVSLQYRSGPQQPMAERSLPVGGADIIQLERQGNTYIMSVARMGERYFSEQVTGLVLGDEVYVGLFVCSHNPDVKEAATFHNVRVIVPPKPGYIPYQDYIGSLVEVMDLSSGHRKIVHTAPNSLQAPNWNVDEHVFTYNSEGLLYDFDLRTQQVTPINTGAVNHNNNDHVHSFDGRLMGISSSTPEDGHSIIFTMPRTGGTPMRVTAKGPSYLHGWSPDGQDLVYTAGRDGEWDIYKIPATGGPEVRLTTSAALDDGPEYTPDGKYIYFNSDRTGTMQIWRMRPDGSNQEQVTFDELHDWFPHISPDGRQILFISFPRSVPSNDHPFYKHVYIRLMPVEGGEPTIVAYLYGGQGSMNVPNWSPDGTRIAFVSNSDFIDY